MNHEKTRSDVILFHHATPILCVNNVPASLDYYKDVLGFEQVWAWSDEKEKFDGGRATFACVRRGHVTIFLCEQGQGQPGAWMSIFLDGPGAVEELYRDYQARRATILEPPTDKPWGMREMQVADPDGNVFRIGAGIPARGEE